ncbi:Uncharacterized protein B5E38_4998 [Bacillus cereus]|nr:Uncharacterized protein B5E38_4998 [Bacillus cereus]ARO65084.1 Uncharacterized protein B5E39_2713 [Bacillus cereus]
MSKDCIKTILQDKALTAKYVVLGFAVVNSVLNLAGVSTIPDEQVNDFAAAISSLGSMFLALNVRAHEIKNLKEKHTQEREDA